MKKIGRKFYIYVLDFIIIQISNRKNNRRSTGGFMKQDIIANCRNALYQILFYGVMIIYFILLFFLLFRKKAAGSFQSVNLIPFHSISAYLFSDDMISRAFALSNLLGNIAIFIPMGVYLPLLIRRKSIFVNTVCVALISAVVEVLQYIFAVGSADIDDVILNTVGGLIGVSLFRVMELLLKDQTKKAVTVLAPVGGIFSFLILFLVNR